MALTGDCIYYFRHKFSFKFLDVCVLSQSQLAERVEP